MQPMGGAAAMTHRAPIALAAGAVASLAGAGALVWVGAGTAPAALAGGLALALAGAALASWSHALSSTESDSQPRADKGPELSRRRMFLRFGAGTAALAAAGVTIPAIRRIDRSIDELRRTEWKAGSVVVGSDGEPIDITRIADGEMVTVYPQHAVGAVDSQAVLIREPLDRFTEAAREVAPIVNGIVIHSKLCTHMACSLGLYQQSTGTLLCPCHQAAFDVLDRGQPVAGPARRPLPRLPIRLTDDGLLVATGDFPDAVGTGFWYRP